MKTRYRGDVIELTAEGAEVAILYRAYLAEYGPDDGATKDAFWAVVNRHPSVTEKLDESEASGVAYALHLAGMRGIAREVRYFAAHCQAERIREEAADLEWQADQIERNAA